MTFTNIKDIWHHDAVISDNLAEELDTLDNGIKYDSSIKEEVCEDRVVLNCIPTKAFQQEFALRDLSGMFTLGKILVISDGKHVTATLASSKAVAHSWTVNRIHLCSGIGLGINGTGNAWIDTETEIEGKLDQRFISVDILAKSSKFAGSKFVDEKVTINTNNIAYITPMNYYNYLECVENQR